jgi:hypothetical protein
MNNLQGWINKNLKNTRCFSEPIGLLQCFPLSLREQAFAYAQVFSPWHNSSKLGSAHLAYRKLSTASANHYNSVANTTLRKPSGDKPAFGDKPLRLVGALASSATTQGQL